MTPFDQPLQQGEYIPQTPQLPVAAIAQSASQLNQRVQGMQSIAQRTMQNIGETAVAPQDQETFQQVSSQYMEQLDSMSEDVEGILDDPNAIGNLASQVQQDIQPFVQTREMYNQALENLEEKEMSENQKDIAREYLRNSIQTQIDEQGNLRTPNQPMSYADEITDIVASFDDIVSSLPEEILGSGYNPQPDVGMLEFLKTEGVDPDRIKSRINTAIRGNARFQGWIRNRTINQIHRNDELSFDNPEHMLYAEQTVKQRLERMIGQYVAEEELTRPTDITLRSLPDDQSGEGGSFASDNLTVTTTRDLNPNAVLPEEHEALVEQQMDVQQRLKEGFINQVEEDRPELAQNIRRFDLDELVSEMSRMERQYRMQREDDEELASRSMEPDLRAINISDQIEQRFGFNSTDSEYLAEVIGNKRQDIENTIEHTSTPFIMSQGEQREDVLSFIKGDVTNIINSTTLEKMPQLYSLAEQYASDWWGIAHPDEDEIRTISQRILNNAGDVGISSDGNLISLTLDGGYIDQNEDQYIEPNTTITIPTKIREGGQTLNTVSSETIREYLSDSDGSLSPRGEATYLNYKWSNSGIPISSNDYTNLSEISGLNLNGSIQRNREGRNNTYSIKIGNDVFTEYDRIRQLQQFNGLQPAQALQYVVGQQRANDINTAAERAENKNEYIRDMLDNPSNAYRFSNRGVALETINRSQ